jgi:hypothetical protein
MNKSIFLSLSVVTLIASCSSVENSCEDVTLASEQIQECQALHKRIITTKNMIVRTELDRRYQQDCIEIRYYRDEKQAAICGNKHKIKEVRKTLEVESE